jgi:hypothetical protein
MERWEQSLKDYEALRKEMPGNLEVAQAILEVQDAMKKLSRSGTEEKHLGVEIVICSNDQLREAISNHGAKSSQFSHSSQFFSPKGTSCFFSLYCSNLFIGGNKDKKLRLYHKLHDQGF